MKFASILLGAALILGTSTLALAEKEQVMLSDGITGMAEIIETTPDSIHAKFSKGEAVLQAARLDPHCFYQIRLKHMEHTAENHVRLAVFCAENGLLNQARLQMKVARAIDPEVDAKIAADADIREKVAQRLAEAAKRHFEKGDLNTAHELVAVIATRLGETSLTERAIEVLDLLEEKMAARDEAEAAARVKAVENAADAEAKAAIEARHAVLVPMEKEQAAARKKTSHGLRQQNKTAAKNAFESAATAFRKILPDVARARTGAAEDPELMAMLAEFEEEVRADAAQAHVHAGNVELGRSAFDQAEEQAKQALEVHPDDRRARALLDAILAGRQEEEDIDDIRERRHERPGGRPTPRSGGGRR